MKLFPAIDLIGGRCVRLLQGRFEDATIYSDLPVEVARTFRASGSRFLHIVDLDGAKNEGAAQTELIARIARESKLEVQVGGGIRSEAHVARLLEAGVSRVVLGSLAVSEPARAEAIIQRFGAKVFTIALDFRQNEAGVPVPLVKGWQAAEGATDLFALVERYAALGVKRFLCTDVARDGMLTGPNFAFYANFIRRFPGLEIQASGGIQGLEDLRELAHLGADATIVGKALYEKRFTLEEALLAAAGESRLTKRIIPCLDVRDGKVVKGVKFREHVVLGEVLELAQRYRNAGADELVFYDITASSEGRSVDRAWVEDIARFLDIPFCVAGGIRGVEDARRVLNAGADKISINSPALERPELIDELAKAFGSQCVVIGVDSMPEDGRFEVYQYTGSEKTSRKSRRSTLEWLKEVESRGAGEVVLNCMNQDGVRSGYDIDQLRQARERLSIPLVASGGAGAPEHFTQVFREARVDAALAAGVFHRNEILIPDLKRLLRDQGVPVRL
jgi:phosphoribosylformimino-5-aminoimidazole carboxamide ribotide isomerase